MWFVAAADVVCGCCVQTAGLAMVMIYFFGVVGFMMFPELFQFAEAGLSSRLVLVFFFLAVCSLRFARKRGCLCLEGMRVLALAARSKGEAEE